MVCRTGVGVDRLDLAAARERGIAVCNAAGCNSIEVSEQMIGLMIAISRKLVRMNQYVREGRWRRHTAELHAYRGPVSRIAGQTLGIVGLGNVGRQVAPRALGMKMNVQAVDPYVAPELAEAMGVKLVSFDELVRGSDVISLHAPLVPATRKMFGKDQFAAMKNTAYFLNCARGGLVDTDALYEALTTDQIAGAASTSRPEPCPPTTDPDPPQRHRTCRANPRVLVGLPEPSRPEWRACSRASPTTEIKDPGWWSSAGSGFGGGVVSGVVVEKPVKRK